MIERTPPMVPKGGLKKSSLTRRPAARGLPAVYRATGRRANPLSPGRALQHGQVPLGDARPREALAHERSAPGSETFAAIGSAEQGLDGPGERSGIVGWNEHAGLTVDHRIGDAVDGARHHGAPARHRLET